MAFVKDMVRMWLHAWKRFVSIALISLLGVAVLTGIYAGCRDAFLATDRFFDTQGLHDIQVLSTAGLTDGDIAALRKVRGVAKVQAERSQEVTFDLGGRKSATMQEIGANGIDWPYVHLFASTKCNITILYNWETVHNPIYYPILLKTLPPTLNQLLKAHIIQSHVHLTYTSANY